MRHPPIKPREVDAGCCAAGRTLPLELQLREVMT